jgi:hypothetical protein
VVGVLEDTPSDLKVGVGILEVMPSDRIQVQRFRGNAERLEVSVGILEVMPSD